MKKEQLLYAITHYPALYQRKTGNTHKGTFGTIGIIGSAEGMSGAIVLAGKSALKAGCGKVFLGFAQLQLPLPFIDSAPELMLKTAFELVDRQDISAWAIGCGLGVSANSENILLNVLAQRDENQPYVFDADALVLMAKLKSKISLNQHCVLTPHPKEASILLNCTLSDVQNNREQAAKEVAKLYHCWAILKGENTVITSPTGEILINRTGNSGLSTAGSGDVLTGIMGSFLAQGMVMSEAVKSAVWIHGIAADILVEKGIGPIGLTASELIDTVRDVRNQIWVQTQQHNADYFE
ncbi:NAD(P)H-hydrate dehydratase [Proteus vulgaris]|uniref:ADP-dependent (S)-NAD(P)H-hydrate dehydratase n=1 Tax=Proteus vulgaris TaxID=585 RepID=A0A6G6SID5_PROVU|nr:NAD(P)H-hydrate dehydratase [Proteus vulgaris]QIF94302.1 NAD(P)H-hydrate dehydratase [Proteus vulgaris]WIF70434.1 NAD(P)H-hydrate dehydratase [Proteus vulgaris]CRL59902.1 Bifunctional NAD(P)H-hydrate repair enzyme Nnr [Proteus vulgaris]SUC01181.1 Nicotinamide nucleotide repair protein [Proteus vulgaris]